MAVYTAKSASHWIRRGRRRFKLVYARIASMTCAGVPHGGYHWVLRLSMAGQEGHGRAVVLSRGRHTLACVACALT